MLIIIKLAAIATLVIFYQTGKRNGENGIKWAFIGFILGFSLSMTIIGETLISIVVACIGVYFTRVQLLKMLARSKAPG